MRFKRDVKDAGSFLNTLFKRIERLVEGKQALQRRLDKSAMHLGYGWGFTHLGIVDAGSHDRLEQGVGKN